MFQDGAGESSVQLLGAFYNDRLSYIAMPHGWSGIYEEQVEIISLRNMRCLSLAPSMERI